jgi:hypothetical protein
MVRELVPCCDGWGVHFVCVCVCVCKGGVEERSPERESSVTSLLGACMHACKDKVACVACVDLYGYVGEMFVCVCVFL